MNALGLNSGYRASSARVNEVRSERATLVCLDLANRDDVAAAGKPAARIDHVIDWPARSAVHDEAVERAKVIAFVVVQVNVVVARFREIPGADKAQARPIARGLLEQVVAGGLVDAALRELGQHVVGVAFLVERLLEKPDRVIVAEGLGIAARGAIGGNLVVLDALGRGNQRRVERLAALRVIEAAACVLDQRRNGAARNGTRGLVQLLEQKTEALDLHLRLRVMLFDRAAQPLGCRAAGHERQLGDHLFFGVHQVVKLGRIQIAEGNGCHNPIVGARAAPPSSDPNEANDSNDPNGYHRLWSSSNPSIPRFVACSERK